jgi:glycosyltransferase involved in cell wall biosynthesis
MRIAYFTETFLPKIDGIVTRLTRTLEQLSDLGHEALVFAPHNPPASYAGHKVVNVPGVAFRPWYPELILGLPRPRLGRELDDFAPDVVHVLNPVILGMWGTAIAKQRNLPLLASFHTDLPQYVVHLKLGFLRPLSHTWIRDVHNQAHVNLCTSQPMVDAAKDLGIKRLRLWPKAVDTVRYHPQYRSHDMRVRLSGGQPEAKLMVYVGRLSHEKRLEWLLPAIQTLTGVQLAFVGSGPAADHLKKRFAGTNTTFVGYLSGDDLAAAYASADVFAFPSDTETLGFVAMEAMASGVAVVAANAGGIPDVVEDGVNGLLFRPGDTADLTQKLEQLLFNDTLRAQLANAARASSEPWSWRASTQTLIGYYDRAMRIHHRFDPPSVF